MTGMGLGCVRTFRRVLLGLATRLVRRDVIIAGDGY
jgi:hypothetical protein